MLRRLPRARSSALPLLAVVALTPAPTLAQEGASPADAVQRRIQELERRLAEVETAARRPQHPADEDPRLQVLDRVAVDGFVSAGFTWNLADPDVHRGANRLRLSDPDHDTVSVPAVRVGFAKSVSRLNELDAGFRIDVMGGRLVQVALEDDGLFGDLPINLSQAYLEFQLPTAWGLPVRVKAGRQASFFGVEGLDLPKNLNYSLSYQATLSPRTLTGVSLEVELGAGLSYTQWLGNGWDRVVDDNDAKSLGGQLAWRADTLSLAVNWILGAERPDSEGDDRWLVEVACQWKPTSSLDVRASALYGEEEGADLRDGGTATFAGLLLAARQGFFEVEGEGFHRLALAGRGGYYRDSGGSRSGEDQTLAELTATLEVRLLRDAAVRVEYRHDWSTAPVFSDGGSSPFGRDHQETLSLELSYTF